MFKSLFFNKGTGPSPTTLLDSGRGVFLQIYFKEHQRTAAFIFFMIHKKKSILKTTLASNSQGNLIKKTQKQAKS